MPEKILYDGELQYDGSQTRFWGTLGYALNLSKFNFLACIALSIILMLQWQMLGQSQSIVPYSNI